MHESTPLTLATWQTFYEIVGTAAGSLTGLQFVVMTLLVQARAASTMREIRAFGTPTVTHFCTALLISALVAAPWQQLPDFAVCIGICGAAGAVYSLRVLWHARKAEYRPDFGDWFWYIALPFLAHLGLLAAAIPLWGNATWPLAAIALNSLVFLLLGIHNSWDTVTYLALQHGKAPDTAVNSE